MAKLSKRKKEFAEKISRTEIHPVDEALMLVKEMAAAKFAESVDVSMNLGIDPRKSDQVVRGSMSRKPKQRVRMSLEWRIWQNR
jgi:large subunit ribosomal protein L1